MKLRKFIAPGAALATAVGLLAAPMAVAAPSPATDQGSDQGVTRNAVTGQDALRQGPALLNKAASKSGLSVDHLKNLLTGANGFWLDREGSPFVVDPGLSAEQKTQLDAAPAPQSQIPAGGTTAAGTAASPAPTDALALHSRTGSKRVIFLDFDGAKITGTAWNDSSRPTIDAKPFDTDGNPGSFNDSERKTIIEVWQRVAEDYAAFDVDVTTADPGDSALNRSSQSDTGYGSHVVITPTADVSPNAGGIAYVGTFDSANNGKNQPAWIFSKNLNNAANNIADAASHEVGHNLGLSHDGAGDQDYSRGQGIWAPIMGAGYGQPLTQWSKGDYKGATNTEDDFSLINKHGLAYIPADHGTSTASATAAAAGKSYNGTILTGTDVAYYKVTVGAAGTLSFTATPASVGADLDIKLSLLDSAGKEIVSDNPAAKKSATSTASGIDAKLSRNLAAGTYYVAIDGIGQGDPQVDGYTDYGSIGRYTLTVS